MAETVNETTTSTDAVLTLHRGVVARWATGAIASQARAQRSVGGRAEAMIDRLAGLSNMGGSFGSDALQLASMMAIEPVFAAKLGPALRSMAVGELADLVQVVLEQEELALEAALAAAARPTGPRAGRNAARPASGPSVTSGKIGRPVAPAQARKLAEVRRALAAVRARAATTLQAQGELAQHQPDVAVGAPIGASVSDRAGHMGSAHPGDGTLPALATTTDFLARRPALRESAHILRPQAGSGALRLDPRTLVSSVAQLSAEAAPTRALRLAEAGADMAMLEPGIDTPAAAGQVFDAAKGAWTVQAQVAAPQRLAAQRALELSAARKVVAAAALAPAHAASPAGRAIAARTVAHSVAPSVGTGAAAALSVAGRIATSSLGARAEASAPSSAGAAPAAGAYAALRAAVVGAEGVVGRAAEAIALHPAFRAAQRRAQAEAGLVSRTGASDSPAGRATLPDAAAPGLATASRTGRALFTTSLGPAVDGRTVAVAARPSAVDFDVRAAAAAAPAWSRWFDAGDRLLQGDVASPVAAIQRPGYVRTDIGAGDFLAIGPDAELAPSPVAAAGAGRGTPSWLTPQAASRAVARGGADAPATTAMDATAPALRVALGLPAMAAATRASAPQTFAPQSSAPQSSAPQSSAQQSSALARSTAQATASVTGAVALAAYGAGARTSARWLHGIEPIAHPPSLRPAFGAEALAVGGRPGYAAAAAPGLAGQRAPWVGGEAAFAAATDGAALTHSLGIDPRIASLGGPLMADAGAGAWLDLGDEADAGVGATAQATGVGRPSAGRSVAAVSARAPLTPGQTPRAPWASAAAAAVQQVVAQFGRTLASTLSTRPQAAPAADAIAFALGSSGVLGLLHHGALDALTPALAEQAAQRMAQADFARGPAQQRAMRVGDAGAGEMLDLGAEPSAATGAGAAGTGVAAGTTRAGAKKAAVVATAQPQTGSQQAARATAASLPAVRARLERALSRAGVRSASGIAASIVDGREPVALRAALALFGEADAAPQDVATRFLSRWLGAAERPTALAQSAPEAIALQPGLGGEAMAKALRPTALATAAAEAKGEPAAEKRVVFEGLAGLAALRSMRGAGEVDGELLALGKVEETPATAAASAAAAATPAPASAATATRAARASRAAAAVRTHRFAPVGLARGRDLLGPGRRQREAALRTVARGSRVGYGSAGLGGGALLGLGGEGEASFFGGGYAASGAATRADRLGAAIEARRGSRGGVGRSMPSGSSERTMLQSGADGGGARELARPAVRPLNSDMPRDLVSPAAIAAEVASAAGAGAGASAGVRAEKAGSMARVLSVTAAAGANVLPLVAPAARAVVSQAAAKLKTESVTSGANPTLGVPLAGHSVGGSATGGGDKGGGAQQGGGDASNAPAQEIDALAMKIARSVLVRIKRERERRGIHV